MHSCYKVGANIFSSMCQEFCSQGEFLDSYTPPPPTHKVPLPGRYPPGQVHPHRYTPRQVHPLTGTPKAGIPPWAVYPHQEQCMLGDTGNKRAVRILLECILVDFDFRRSKMQGRKLLVLMYSYVSCKRVGQLASNC